MKVWAKTQDRFTKPYRKHILKKIKEVFEWCEIWEPEYEQQIEEWIDGHEELYRYMHERAKEINNANSNNNLHLR